MENSRRQKLLSAFFGFAGAVFAASAVYSWFTGSHEWSVLGLEVRLDDDEWWKPWWTGTGLWLASIGLAGDSLPIVSRLGHLARKLGVRAGVGLDGHAMRWTCAGVFIGAASGFLFAIHYYHLVPRLAFQTAAVISFGLAGGALHRIFYSIVEAAASRLFPRSGAVPRARVRLCIYIVAWSGLVTGALPAWEARLTEPIFLQSAIAIAFATVFTWLLLSGWRLSGPLGFIRRASLFVASSLVLAACVVSWFVESNRMHPETPPRDRVLLITIDTTRADHLSCYGYGRETSPNLDELAASGALFTRAFAPMGITDPSHASILTGAYPRTHGVLTPFEGKISGPLPSLADMFKKNGYATAAVTSRVVLNPESLGVQGFDYISVPRISFETGAPEAVRRAENWLSRNRNRDVFLWVHFFDPHIPYQPHPGFPGKFIEENRGSKGGANWLDEHEGYSEKEVEYRIDLYDTEIAFMDHWIGKLLRGLDNMKPKSRREPFIVVIADHGEMLGEKKDHPARYAFGHGGILYNGVAHIPWIMSWPGQIPAGKTLTQVVEVVDLPPTMSNYLLETEFHGQGRDLVPVIQNNGATGGTAFIQRRRFKDEFPRQYLKLDQYVMVDWPYKLFLTEDGTMELYDIEADWNETRDLAESNPSLAKTLAQRLRQWMERTPEAKSSKRNLSDNEIKKLKALGYIE